MSRCRWWRGPWEVPGRLSIRDWAEFFGREDLNIDRSVSTVAGLILAKLGRVPQVGAEVLIRNLRLKVEAMSGRMIEKVSVSLVGKTEASATPDVAALGAGGTP